MCCTLPPATINKRTLTKGIDQRGGNNHCRKRDATRRIEEAKWGQESIPAILLNVSSHGPDTKKTRQNRENRSRKRKRQTTRRHKYQKALGEQQAFGKRRGSRKEAHHDFTSQEQKNPESKIMGCWETKENQNQFRMYHVTASLNVIQPYAS